MTTIGTLSVLVITSNSELQLCLTLLVSCCGTQDILAGRNRCRSFKEAIWKQLQVIYEENHLCQFAFIFAL